MLFLATCASTWLVAGPIYAACVMTILLFHEAGHYVQAQRYGVPASLPYFLPMPISPLGTFGAVIAMSPHMPHRRALFDIGISGPLAGLVPCLAFTVWGVSRAEIRPIVDGPQLVLGEPLLVQWLVHLVHGPIPEGSTVFFGPIAYAGWVGILVTALNLLPIGQLDGGHILYALLRRRAHAIAWGLMLAAMIAVVVRGLWGWSLLLVLLLVVGPRHPPTRNDALPLDRGRALLGWLTLAFFIVGFTPSPLDFR
ncbi:MAG: site-2 protease family protein [Acidobacteriota bacterium]